MNNLGDLLNWARQSRQISYKYAWYADPEDFEIKMIHKRLFDPEMDEALEAVATRVLSQRRRSERRQLSGGIDQITETRV